MYENIYRVYRVLHTYIRITGADLNTTYQAHKLVLVCAYYKFIELILYTYLIN